ncbi:MAG: ribosome maturation factor RimM [Cyanobacteriota bacterium]|nr:ribosome maturation factor RimM [Cyanobacteriota bacterium]
MNEFPSSPQNLNLDSWLEIGTIVAPQGLQGEVRVLASSDFPDRFEKPGKRWLLAPDETEPQEIELLRGRYIPGKNVYVVRLENIENRDGAESLRGYKLLVRESDRPQLEEDEYHIRDLIDIEVSHHLTGEVLGKVISIIPAGNDLLEVELFAPVSPNTPTPSRNKKAGKTAKLSKKNTVLIPFVKEIVPVVNIPNGPLEILPPSGLLEL